jgi:hypothetical protein
MTPRDLIRRSFQALGVVAEGETPSAAQLNDAFSSLNDMLDSWSNEGLLIYQNSPQTFPLVVGQSTYTIGTTGNFVTVRPMRIENARIQEVQSGLFTEFPVEIVTQDEWVGIPTKSVTTSLPQKLFAQGTYPLETISLWPVPSVANNLILWCWQPLTSFATVDTAISMPPGYQRALRTNLAIELAPEYGKQATPELSSAAMESKANIKRMNIKDVILTSDFPSQHRKPFNYLTGE